MLSVASLLGVGSWELRRCKRDTTQAMRESIDRICCIVVYAFCLYIYDTLTFISDGSAASSRS